MADPKETEKEQAKEPLVSVTVIAENHTHKGKVVEKGGKIDVSKDQLKWLIKNKIIKG